MQVEGVSYEIDWRNFKRGTSLFFPCLDGKRAEKAVKQVTDRLKLEVVTKVVVVDGIQGLRVWRA